MIEDRAQALLAELEGESRAYPHAAELAADLRAAINRPVACLIVWTEDGSTEVHSVKLNHGDETAALCDAHGCVMSSDDPAIEILRDAIAERGRHMLERTEGLWHFAQITVDL